MKNEYYIHEFHNAVSIMINYKGKMVSTLIDYDDFKIVDSIKGTWHMNGGYVTYQPYVNGKRFNIRLHRLIMSAPEGLLVDHINRNTMDNRKSNLRIVTEQENLNNKGIYKNTKSGIKGVCWNKQTQKWRATASGLGNGKQKHLGSFETIEEAKQAVIKYNMTQG